jgi:hypothetical protein
MMPYGIALFGDAPGSQVAAIALGAYAALGFASEHRTDGNHFDTFFLDVFGLVLASI